MHQEEIHDFEGLEQRTATFNAKKKPFEPVSY